MFCPERLCKDNENFYIFAYQLIEVMKIEDINHAEWGYLLDNPNVIFRIEQINIQNETIEYHLFNDARRYPARFQKLVY